MAQVCRPTPGVSSESPSEMFTGVRERRQTGFFFFVFCVCLFFFSVRSTVSEFLGDLGGVLAPSENAAYQSGCENSTDVAVFHI